MAEGEKAGGIYIEIEADVAKLLVGQRQAESALDSISSTANCTSKAMDGLDKESKSAGSSLSKISGYVKSVDSSMQTLNTNVSAVAAAINQANTNAAASGMTLTQMNVAMQALVQTANAMSQAMQSTVNNTGKASGEYSRAEGIIEGLGNQIAILDEAQENGAKSAAILAAQLRAGSSATDEEKQKIGELTGRLYDMKTGVDTGAKSHGNWKSTMQQAGYQVQDFIVQVQGGQSALIAFSQQGSQLAGAFGPGGAVVGAIIALGSVLAGTLIAGLNNGKNAMDAMKAAVTSFDQVISISQNGVAAYSDKFAILAKTNAAVATLMKQQAQLELQAALSKVSKELQKASGDFIALGDSIVSSLGGSYASVKLFNDYLSTLSITTDDFSEAMRQAAASGQAGQFAMNSMIATVGSLASKFQISDQQAYSFAKQLSDIAKNPSDEKLRALITTLQEVGSGHSSGAEKAREYAKRLLEIATTSADASMRLKALKEMTDALTSSQDKALQQAKQELFISKQTGSEKQKALAWRDAENQGLKQGTQAFRDYYNVRLQTYKQQEANSEAARNEKKTLSDSESAAKRAANQQESVAQKLANLRQQSELAASSTEELSREQAMLRAEQSLGKSASVDQVQQARNYAAAVWDTAAAIKARNAVPELKENADYNAQKSQLESLKDARDAQGNLIISQQQYNQASEQLEQQHQVNLAKIRAGQVVTPQQQAQGEVDPVQRLANQHAQELALIQQFETQKGQITQRGLELMNAANTQYEQQRTAAQWEMLSQQSLGYNMLTSAVDAFSGNASNAITGLLTGTMSAQEAMRSLGNTILNSVINSIVQVGVEALKNYILGQTLGAASVASSVGMAATTASAWAPAAALASLATLGTNAAPASAGITSTVGLASGLALAGGRKNGGPVSPGNIYPVGEDNLPEFVQTNKGLFMIPGDDGRVFSNKDVTSGSPSIKKASTGSEYVSSSKNSASQSDSGGGKQIQVNVQFYDQTSGGQHSFEAQAMQEGNVVTVDAFLNDLDRGGPMTSGIKDRFGLSVKANGAY
ncbi:tail protein (tape measure) [Klebsiella oxytoca]|uniref:tail protein (tape measure) n=1 Tax=Klebsiella oxytoca TaxID=571 RepID=UPI00190E8038|nr:tail protein (tape measure) [Klebsiella oxytoca]MBZ7483122.1 tail protein (tape measure) [Klebsiella oxytoca]